MRILIVDDEPLARARIANLLGARNEGDELRQAANGLDAVAQIEEWQPDILFLDVQMPGLDGFGVVEQVGPTAMPVTIFATAFDEFAIRAFDAQALDYLLKPFDADRFAHALARAREQVALRRRDDLETRLEALLQGVGSRPDAITRFVVRNGARITFVGTEQVDWLGAEGNYVALHVGPRVHLVRGTLTDMERRLDPAHFLRIHRSTIVNIGSVTAIESLFRGEYLVILRDGTRLNSSGTYRERLEEALLKD